MKGSDRLARATLRGFALAIRIARALGLEARWTFPSRANRLVARSGLFDPGAYLQAHPHAGLGVLSPLDHFMAHGARAGCDPNPYFSVTWYLANNPDVAETGVNPLLHYIRAGEREGRAPSRLFDPAFYAARHRDVATYDGGPLAHFLAHGRREGRLPRAPDPACDSDAPLAGEAEIAVVKPARVTPGDALALLACRAPAGHLRDHALAYIDALRAAGRTVVVVVVVATDAPVAAPPALLEALNGLYVRRKAGGDFAAWAHVMQVEPALYAAGSLLLTSDRESPGADIGRIAGLLAEMDRDPGDVVGLSDGYEGEWHIRSDAMLLKPRALRAVALQRFMLATRDRPDAVDGVGTDDLRFGSTLRAAGLATHVLFPTTPGAGHGPEGRRKRIARALPLSESAAPPDRDDALDAEPWREGLATHGFGRPAPRRFAQTAPTAALTYAAPATVTPQAVAPSQEAWLLLAPPDAFAHPDIAGLVAAAAAARPDVALFYGDVALLRGERRPKLILKPALDRTQLVAHDYVGPTLAVRGSAFHALNGLRPDAGTARLYDLVLRALAAGFGVDRIPQVLTALPVGANLASMEDRRGVLRDALAASGEPLELIAGRTADSFGVARGFEAPPPVTLIVPTMQSLGPGRRPHIAALLDSVARTDWPMDQLNVLVGDDAPSDALYQAGRWPFRLKRVNTARPPGEPFNYAVKMNRLWRLAETEHLVLLNDDVVATDPSWLRALMTFAVSQDVGAVGARLLFPDGRLQHAGVIGGLFGLCAHPWFGQPENRPTYQDWAMIQREWSIVTGAVLATRRSVLERVNGFDPAFSLDFNDVDLCLKMRLLGLRVVYTPYAELIHHEKASRGDHPTLAAEMAVFLRRWHEMLDSDPSYHPAMSRNSYDPAPVPEAGAWYEKL